MAVIDTIKRYTRTRTWLGHTSRGSLGGEDRAMNVGTDLRSMIDGKILNYSNAAAGKVTRVTHISGIAIEFEHESRYLRTNGTRVKAGEIIAESGQTGAATGPHVHCHGLRTNGRRRGYHGALRAIARWEKKHMKGTK